MPPKKPGKHQGSKYDQNYQQLPEAASTSATSPLGSLPHPDDAPFTPTPAPRDQPKLLRQKEPAEAPSQASFPSSSRHPAVQSSLAHATSQPPEQIDLPAWGIDDAIVWLIKNKQVIKQELNRHFLEVRSDDLGSPYLFPRAGDHPDHYSQPFQLRQRYFPLIPPEPGKEQMGTDHMREIALHLVPYSKFVAPESKYSKDENGVHDTANNNSKVLKRLKEVTDRCGTLHIRYLNWLDNFSGDHDGPLRGLFGWLIIALARSIALGKYVSTVVLLEKNWMCKEAKSGIGRPVKEVGNLPGQSTDSRATGINMKPSPNARTNGKEEGGDTQTEGPESGSSKPAFLEEGKGNKGKSLETPGQKTTQPDTTVPANTGNKRKQEWTGDSDQEDGEEPDDPKDDQDYLPPGSKRKKSAATPRGTATPGSSAKNGSRQGGRKGRTKLKGDDRSYAP